MTKYMLLRDNKESGPYSFDELKAKGLKAYDLVWIDGRSAAWRYPCEVEELSSFAPAVEEQPFDRFYKKPARENADLTTTAKRVAGTETSTRVSLSVQPASPASGSAAGSGPSVFSGEPSAVPGKRIIYVTLPAGRNTPVKESTRSSSAPYERTPYEPTPYEPAVTPVYPPLSPEYSPISEHASLPSSPGVSAPRSAGDKPSQARENTSIGEEIMPLTGQKRNSSRIMQPVAVVVCVLALLAAGIFIGLSINKSNLGFTQKIAGKNVPVNPPPPVDHVTGSLPASSAAPALQVQTLKTDTANTASLMARATTVNIPKKTVSKGKSSPLSQKTQSAPPAPVKDSALINLPVVHREASHRTDMPIDKIDKDIIRNNLSNLVSVGTNSYAVGAFGGISGVQLTVSNKSVYPLDLVVVEVQYIQANKKVFKTEILYFRGIGPGSALMQEAPNSSRGVKVQYKITLVNSKELGLSYSAL